MTPIKRRLLYIFRGSLLRLRISWQGQQLTLSVGYHVDRSRWDGQRCARNSTHGPDKTPAATVNRALGSLERKVDSAFTAFEDRDSSPSLRQLREAIFPEDAPKAASTVAELVLSYRTTQAVLRQWSDRTRRINKQALDCLTELYGNLSSISSIGEREAMSLLEYMTDKRTFVMRHLGDKAETKRGLSNVTINRYMTMIRSFARWCEAQGHGSSPALLASTKQLTTARLPVVYLTMEELSRFRAAQVSEANAEVREAFALCCFTGLRYSDARSLTWGQVSEDMITVVTKKTHDRLEIELNKFSRAILAARKRGGAADRVFRLPDTATDTTRKATSSPLKKDPGNAKKRSENSST